MSATVDCRLAGSKPTPGIETVVDVAGPRRQPPIRPGGETGPQLAHKNSTGLAALAPLTADMLTPRGTLEGRYSGGAAGGKGAERREEGRPRRAKLRADAFTVILAEWRLRRGMLWLGRTQVGGGSRRTAADHGPGGAEAPVGWMELKWPRTRP